MCFILPLILALKALDYRKYVNKLINKNKIIPNNNNMNIINNSSNSSNGNNNNNNIQENHFKSIPIKYIGDIELSYQSINSINKMNSFDSSDSNSYINKNQYLFHPLPKALRDYYRLFIYVMIFLFCLIIGFTIIIDFIDGIEPDYVEK